MQSPAKRYKWALACLKKNKARFTHPRQLILRALAARKLPVSLDVLGKELRDQCNLVTVYRTMHCLQEMGVVRQVRLTARCTSFVLAAPGEHCDYLVCDQCGAVSDLPDAQPILELEKQIAARSGFRALHHEAEFYGICLDCQSAAR